jgi:hypothetical protein
MIAGAVPALAGADPAAGQPVDVEALVSEVERLRSSARDPGAPAGGRDELHGKLLSARQRLIDAAPDDDRAASWMLDQAADILGELSMRSDEASVLLGIPTPDQVDRVRDGAGRARDLVRRARDAATRSVARLEARLFRAADPAGADAREAAEIEGRLEILIDRELQWRARLLECRSIVLLAAAGQRAGRAASPAELREAAAALASLAVSDAPDELERRLLLAEALLQLARSEASARRRAMVQFESVADAPGAARLARLVALMGLAQCAGSADDARARAEALLRAPSDPELAMLGPAASLLAAEGAAGALLAASGTFDPPSDPQGRPRRLEESLAPLAGLLDRAPAGLDAAVWQSLVLRKLGVAAGDSRRPEELSTAAALGQAILLLSRRAIDESDRLRSEAAAGELLAIVLERPDVEGLRALALRELGLLRLRSREPAGRLEGARLLTRLVREFPASDGAPDAARTAIETARDVLSGAEAGVRAEARECLVGALREAIVYRPPLAEAGAWRIDLARLLLQQPASGFEGAALGEFLQLLEAEAGAADSDSESLAEQRIRAALARTATSAEPSPDELAVADLAIGWARLRRSVAGAELLVAGAEVLLRARNPRAVEVFREALASAPPALSARAGLGLGRALRQQHRPDEAFAALRSVAAELDRPPAAPGDPTRPADFWGAWAEMLEILAAANSDGSRTASIRLNLNRLALIDPALGPEAFRSRIAAIRDSLKPPDSTASRPPPGG